VLARRGLVVRVGVPALLLGLAEPDLALVLDERHKVAPAHALPASRSEELEAEEGGEEGEAEDEEDEVGERAAVEVTRGDRGDEVGPQLYGRDGLRQEGPEEERGRARRQERVRDEGDKV